MWTYVVNASLDTSQIAFTSPYVSNIRVQQFPVNLGNTRGILVAPNGLSITTTNDSAIVKFSMSTPFDLSSITGSQTLQQYVSADLWSPNFSGDGNNIFFLDKSNNRINRHTLTTAFDPLSMNVYGFNQSLSIGVDIRGMTFGKNGTRLYVAEHYNPTRVRQYNLSTAYDLNTASWVQTLTVNSYGGGGELFFNPTGTVLYWRVYPTNPDGIRAYTLSTAWEINTITNANDAPVVLQDNALYALAPTFDGYLYRVDFGGSEISKLSVSPGADISLPSSVINPPSEYPIGQITLPFYTNNGGSTVTLLNYIS